MLRLDEAKTVEIGFSATTTTSQIDARGCLKQVLRRVEGFFVFLFFIPSLLFLYFHGNLSEKNIRPPLHRVCSKTGGQE